MTFTAEPKHIRESVIDEMDRWQGYQDRRRTLKKLGNQRTADQAAEYKTLHVWANEDRRAWKQRGGNNWVPIWPELTTGEA